MNLYGAVFHKQIRAAWWYETRQLFTLTVRVRMVKQFSFQNGAKAQKYSADLHFYDKVSSRMKVHNTSDGLNTNSNNLSLLQSCR